MDFLKVVIAAIVMGAVVLGMREVLNHKLLGVILPTVLGAFVYLTLCVLLKVSTLQQFMIFVNSKLKLKRGEAGGK